MKLLNDGTELRLTDGQLVPELRGSWDISMGIEAWSMQCLNKIQKLQGMYGIESGSEDNPFAVLEFSDGEAIAVKLSLEEERELRQILERADRVRCGKAKNKRTLSDKEKQFVLSARAMTARRERSSAIKWAIGVGVFCVVVLMQQANLGNLNVVTAAVLSSVVLGLSAMMTVWFARKKLEPENMWRRHERATQAVFTQVQQPVAEQ